MKFTTKALFISVLLLLPTFTHAVEIPLNMGLKATDKKTNGAVTELQSFLNVYPTTGYFGIKTQVSLRNFQKKFKLPQTGTVNSETAKFINSYIAPSIIVPTVGSYTSLTPQVNAPLIAPIIDQPTIATSTWERGTRQRIYIPSKIVAEKTPIDIRLLSRNAFTQDDIYTITLDLPSTATAFDWTVDTSIAQSKISLSSKVPGGQYLLQICALSCYEHPTLINIPRLTAPKSDTAVMASINAEPYGYNYIIVDNKIIDQNGTETNIKTKTVYKGSEITLFTKTKTYSSIQSLVQISAISNTNTYQLLSTTTNSRSFKFIVGENITIPEGIYDIKICIANECNVTLEKLEIKKTETRTETLGRSSFSIPQFLQASNFEVIGTTTVSRTFTEPGKQGDVPAPLKVTIQSGSIDSSSYIKQGFTTTTVNSYTVYELRKSNTRLIKLGNDVYAIVEGRSVLIDYVVNSIRRIYQ